MLKKYVIAGVVGVVLTVLLGLLAGFGGAACHCNTPLRVLFPYVSMADDSWETLFALLLGIQYPVYAVCVAAPKRADRQMAALFIVFVVHAGAVALASPK
jgi:hypothetical protein